MPCMPGGGVSGRLSNLVSGAALGRAAPKVDRSLEILRGLAPRRQGATTASGPRTWSPSKTDSSSGWL
jgi:hypothetical protein